MAKMQKEVEGVFSGDSGKQEPSTNPNTPEQQTIVDMIMQDLPYFRENRQTIEDMWRQEDRFYEGGKKHWEGLREADPDNPRPDSTDNIAGSQVESIVSALTGWVPEGKFEPTEDGDEERARELQRFIPFELRQIKFKAKHIKAVRRFVIHGLLLYKTVYDPTIEGGRGNNRFIGQNDIIPLDYGSFFPDPRIRDFLYLQQGKAHIIQTMKDLEFFHENDTYGEQGKKVTESEDSSNVEIFEQNKTEQASNKQKRSGLIEYWYKGKPKMLTKDDKELFKNEADETLLEGKDPSVNLAKAKGTMKGVHCIHISSDGVFLKHVAYVYDHGQYPIVARSLFPVEGSLWPKGYMRDLMSPQIMLNKFSELAVEQTAKMGNGAVMYEEGAIEEGKKNIWKRLRSRVGAMLPVTNLDGVKEIEGKGPPTMIMNFIQHWLTILQKIPRRFDSANGGTNFQGESGRHAEALQSAAQGHLSTPSELIEDALVEVFEQYIELIAQFYKTERIGRVLGKPASVSRQQLLKTAETEYETGNMVINPETGLEEPEVLILQEEYTPMFDISVSIGVETPRDREYFVEMAFTLFKTLDPLTQMPMIDGKALQYAVQNGRLESFEVINERMQKEQMLMQQIEQLQAENMQLNEALGATTQQVDELAQNDMSTEVEAQRLAQEQQNQQFDRTAQMRKLDIEEMKVTQMGQRTM